MRDSLVLYECALCHAYLETYTKATLHLGMKHSEACRTNYKRKNKEDGDLIKSKKFPESIISLQRLTLEDMKKIHKESPTPVVETSKPRVKKRTAGRMEIQLDTLKAGEIETLITDLFKKSNAPALSGLESGPEIRRSSRKVKNHFKSYGELDSDDEEIIRTGRGRNLAHNKVNINKDPNYDDSDFEDNGIDDDVDSNHHKKHLDPVFKRSNRNCSSRNRNIKKKECKICGKVLKMFNTDSMAMHMKRHEKTSAEDPSKPFVCPVCHYRFGFKDKLQRHFMLHLENNPFKCEFLGCGKKFNSNYNLQRHIGLHTDRTIHQCTLCPAKFSRQPRLLLHIAEFHSENSTKVYKARSSNRNYRIKSIHELAPDIKIEKSRAHAPAEKDEVRFDLESVHLADRIITTEDEDIHIKGEKLSPQKRQPGASSPTSSYLSTSPSAEAKLNQNRSKASKIPETPMELVNIVRSDPVVKRLQETNPESLKEVIGSRYTYNKNNLKGDFKCQICSWTGTRAFSFTKHMQNYHGAAAATPVNPDNPLALGLTCGSCGYRSNSMDDLTSHISKVHVQKNKFPCTFCGARFQNTSRRKEHERKVHLTEKTFSCSKCDAKFAGSGGLHKHLLHKHDPEYQKMLETTFKCKICGRVLSDKKSYLRHGQLHTNPEVFRASCKICGQNCATIFVLRRHIQYVHAGVKNPYLRSTKSQVRKNAAKSSSMPSTSQIQIENVPDNPGTLPAVQQTELTTNPSNTFPQTNDLLRTDNHVAENTEILGF